MKQKWDYEVDVVIVGYGGAGAVTAITARDAGANVLVLEKAPKGGGFTATAGGFILSPTNVDDAFAYISAFTRGLIPKEICRVWAEEMCKNKEWLDQMGIKNVRSPRIWSDFKNLPGWSSMRSVKAGGSVIGSTFFWQLDKRVRDRNIKVLVNTPVKELIQDPVTKEIRGVIAVRNGTDVYIKARKAVVLSCGGFEFNEEMICNFLRPYPMKFCGPKYNTGDGIIMGLKVGAMLWHMNVVTGVPCIWFPEYESAYTPLALWQSPPRFIFVDKYGKRFCNEDLWESMAVFWQECQHFDLDLCDFDRVPFYMIFDEVKRKSGPVGANRIKHLTVEEGALPEWSEDNTKEIEKGWIKKGDTIEELAAKIGPPMNPNILRKTVDNWNSYCKGGHDPIFGRNPENMIPLDTPPYYAVPMWPGFVNTLGGLMFDEKCRVLNVDKKPIPRLYVAGELGSPYAHTYGAGGGGNLGWCLASGRIAGRNAAAEQPWE